MEIKLKVKDLDETTFQVKIIGEKTVYSPDKLASEWVREGTRAKAEDAPQMQGYCQVKSEGRGKMISGAFGYMNSNANSVNQNTQFVGLYSSAFSGANGLSILSANFMKVIALFTARKSIMPNWINCLDAYMVPNTAHTEYAQWNNDAIVYALFNNKSQQSSLRAIDYKGKKWDIQNHFFFMSNQEMSELANKQNFNEMYQDAKRFNIDRHVYTLLETTNLSADAKEILEMAKELIRKSFSMRVTYHGEHPEYHLQAHDAGWAQLKPMLKEYFKSDLDAFITKYKAFENRMRQGVYKFGFLRE